VRIGKRTYRLCAASALLLSAAFGLQTRADDASCGVALPAPVAIPAGAIRAKSSSVTISSQMITVQMSVEVINVKGAILKLTLPRFGWMGEAEPYPDRDFPELKILIDGKIAALGDRFRAFIGKEEITRDLEQDKLDPFVIVDTPPFLAWKNEDGHSVDGLKAAGAIEADGNRYVAKWDAQRIITLDVPSGVHELSITHKARSAFHLLTIECPTHLESLAGGCISANDLATAFRERAAAITVQEYAVPATIAGERPESVEAHVDVSDAQQGRPDLVAFCGRIARAVITTNGRVSGPARPDSDGKVYVLVIKKTAP
jgi:hypothetical protein